MRIAKEGAVMVAEGRAGGWQEGAVWVAEEKAVRVAHGGAYVVVMVVVMDVTSLGKKALEGTASGLKGCSPVAVNTFCTSSGFMVVCQASAYNLGQLALVMACSGLWLRNSVHAWLYTFFNGPNNTLSRGCR